MFGTILISLVTLMHGYVLWRVAAPPFPERPLPRAALLAGGVLLWALFISGRLLGHTGAGGMSAALELLGMDWMAALFLLFVCFLAADLCTGFGFLLPRPAPALRMLALVAGTGLSAAAVVQGMRPPVVQDYEVYLPGLPENLDGTVLAGLSDMHLGSLLGRRWLEARVEQVRALHPDIVVLLGDIEEGHGGRGEELLPAFKGLSARYGVWAVPGNHDSHGRASLLRDSGFEILNDRWGEVRPGLVIAGVEDLTARRRSGERGDPAFPYAVAGGKGGRRRRRPDALRAHARRAGLAVRLPGPPPVPAVRGKV